MLSYCQVHQEANNYLKHPSPIHTTEFLKQSLSIRVNSANSSFFLSLQPQRAEGRLRPNGNVQLLTLQTSSPGSSNTCGKWDSLQPCQFPREIVHGSTVSLTKLVKACYLDHLNYPCSFSLKQDSDEHPCWYSWGGCGRQQGSEEQL